MIRAVIVDFGGVLALEPTAQATERLRSCCGLDAEGFIERWYEHRLPYDRGELTAAEYWSLTGVVDESRLEAVLAADADAWSRCDPAVVAWLPALRSAGLRTALLSNMPREQWAGLSPGFAWLTDLDELTLSFELGSAKPDEAPYRHCLGRLGVEPHEAVFVDDRAENVEAAAALGIAAFRYTGVDMLRAELASRFDGTLPLP